MSHALFPVEPGSNNFVMGLTTPWEMKGWTFEILNFDDVEYESLSFYGEFEAMREAQKVRDKGGVAFLLVHTAMLGAAAPTVVVPNHWVSFLGNLQIDDGVWWQWDSGRISFDCYSWGKRYHVDLDEGQFEDYIWGAVYGKP